MQIFDYEWVICKCSQSINIETLSLSLFIDIICQFVTIVAMSEIKLSGRWAIERHGLSWTTWHRPVFVYVYDCYVMLYWRILIIISISPWQLWGQWIRSQHWSLAHTWRHSLVIGKASILIHLLGHIIYYKYCATH